MSVWLKGSRLTPQSPAGCALAIEPVTGRAARATARTNRRRNILRNLSLGTPVMLERPTEGRRSDPPSHLRRERARAEGTGERMLAADASEQGTQVLAAHLDAEVADHARVAPGHRDEPHAQTRRHTV